MIHDSLLIQCVALCLCTASNRFIDTKWNLIEFDTSPSNRNKNQRIIIIDVLVYVCMLFGHQNSTFAKSILHYDCKRMLARKILHLFHYEDQCISYKQLDSFKLQVSIQSKLLHSSNGKKQRQTIICFVLKAHTH